MAKKKKIKIPAHSKVNQAMVEALGDLLEFNSISYKEALTDMYFDYCLTMQDLPLNFKQNTEAIYFLTRFLKVCEENLNNEQS
jgi:hypothetical protein